MIQSRRQALIASAGPTQTTTGKDMVTYAADVTSLVEHLDLKGAVRVGHSAGGGEVARYFARARPDLNTVRFEPIHPEPVEGPRLYKWGCDKLRLKGTR